MRGLWDFGTREKGKRASYYNELNPCAYTCTVNSPIENELIGQFWPSMPHLSQYNKDPIEVDTR